MKLVYDINAFAMIEEMSGQSLIDLISNPETLVSIKNLRLFVWAGLLAAEPKLSLTQAGLKFQELLASGKTLADVANMISEAIKASGLIEKVEDGPENPPAQ